MTNQMEMIMPEESTDDKLEKDLKNVKSLQDTIDRSFCYLQNCIKYGKSNEAYYHQTTLSNFIPEQISKIVFKLWKDFDSGKLLSDEPKEDETNLEILAKNVKMWSKAHSLSPEEFTKRIVSMFAKDDEVMIPYEISDEIPDRPIESVLSEKLHKDQIKKDTKLICDELEKKENLIVEMPEKFKRHHTTRRDPTNQEQIDKFYDEVHKKEKAEKIIIVEVLLFILKNQPIHIDTSKSNHHDLIDLQQKQFKFNFQLRQILKNFKGDKS